MRYITDETEMKLIDKYTIEEIGIPSMVLMERAALAVAEEVSQRMSALRVLCVCGCGNNGGDGLAAARILSGMGSRVELYILGDQDKAGGEWKLQKKITDSLGISVVNSPRFEEYTVIIDALFGIGLSRPLEGIYREFAEAVNASGIPVAAVDIPSGIDASGGRVLGAAVRAAVTISFGCEKLGCILYPGAEYAGRVILRDIGFPSQAVNWVCPKFFTYGTEDLRRLPGRVPYSNKGTYGKVLMVTGQKDMAGAAWLSGEAAYRMGTGLVRLLAPEANRQILQSLLPEAVLTVYEGEEDEKALLEAFNWADVIGAGSGLGMGKRGISIMRKLSEYASLHPEKPVVLDADGINVLSLYPELIGGFQGHTVITPHLGEMAGFLKKEIAWLQNNLAAAANSAAKEHSLICVLKDARTVVCGKEAGGYVNTTGNSGMAVGGSGDVLAGIICGCLSMGLSLKEAACMGVYLHGLAGDRMKAEMGERPMLARDLLTGLKEVLKEIEHAHKAAQKWGENGY